MLQTPIVSTRIQKCEDGWIRLTRRVVALGLDLEGALSLITEGRPDEILVGNLDRYGAEGVVEGAVLGGQAAVHRIEDRAGPLDGLGTDFGDKGIESRARDDAGGGAAVQKNKHAAPGVESLRGPVLESDGHRVQVDEISTRPHRRQQREF